ncbi:Dioxygenase [Amycolatopsis xylanica]|uniref:Dioxygenase n=1 Tax=Amycolatopsis xylanica TaxID=589385 RepID=A0A1H3K047_9PSEU|nr:intradiol ring-cleavage dioxygenase [Amycolatopsis xylanica]SDY45521.1 Dioxygenase [Amycolatopsis xylanica]
MTHHDHEPEIHDRGLAFDMATMLDRRRVLALFGAAGLATIAGGAALADGGTTASAAETACAGKVPEEIVGPFPSDGTNGPNILTKTGVVRSDIRSSFGGLSGTAAGVPVRMELTMLKAGTCAPLTGAAVYVWQCDKDGKYSMYASGVLNQNYLRGVQAASSTGLVTFTTIFPGAYPGRWPHIHFEVYRTVAEATAAGDPIATSQLAFPAAECTAVYSTAPYASSLPIFRRTSLSQDMVFRDGYSKQMPVLTGSPSAGYTAKLSISI